MLHSIVMLRHRKVVIMNINSELYDTLKYVAQVVIPAVGTLWFAIATIWGLPFSEEILGTLTAIDAFMGALLHIDNKSYTDAVSNWAEPSNGIEEDEDMADAEFEMA